MGQIIFGMPEDVSNGLDPARSQAILDATKAQGDILREAVQDVNNTPTGHKIASDAIGMAKDGNVYIYIDPVLTSSSFAARSLNGNAVIAINPCDITSSKYVTPDSKLVTPDLRGTIAHELEHIANGDHERVLRGGTEGMESKAIKGANAVREELGLPNPERRTDNYGSSSVITDPACTNSTLPPLRQKHGSLDQLPSQSETQFASTAMPGAPEGIDFGLDPRDETIQYAGAPGLVIDAHDSGVPVPDPVLSTAQSELAAASGDGARNLAFTPTTGPATNISLA